MKAIITGIQAETLTPFAYHSLMVQGGSSTLPELISDQAIMFGLAATLGMMHASVCLPPKGYRRDLQAMPWRASVFTTQTPALLAPLTRRLNLEEEAGFKNRHYTVTSKGNFKTYFSTQEVPAGITYHGALFGFDPFTASGRQELVIRTGLHRNGMVRLTPAKVEQVQLNAATAHLFGRELSVERYLLYGIQLTPQMSCQAALSEVQQWN
jgi:hypothetical protein